MNKLLAGTLLIGSLFLLDSPAAEAHGGAHGHKSKSHHYSRSYDRDYYYSDRRHRSVRHYRTGKLPRWLKRERGFRNWYKHSRYRYNRRLSWQRLFDIYLWEYDRRRRYYRHY